MRSNQSFRHYCRRRPGWSDDWLYKPEPGQRQQEFGDVTSLVNSLRNRRLFQYSSLRLLSELVEVMRGSLPKEGSKAIRPAQDVVLQSDRSLVGRAAASSPCLFRSFQVNGRGGFGNPNARMVFHRVLLCRQPTSPAPVAALAQVLAATIAREFDEPAATVTFDHDRAVVRLWLGDKSVDCGEVKTFATLATLLAGKVETRRGPGSRPPLVHLIVAAPSSARELPAGFRKPPGFKIVTRRRSYGPDVTAGYDRIVYLAKTVPATLPEWETFLTPAARWRDPDNRRDEGPYFCSVVPSLVGPAPKEPQPFDTRQVDDEFQTPRPKRRPPPGWRLERDHCRLPWQFDKNDRTAPADLARQLLSDAAGREIAARWARAVTNRRVGMALSGGGASSYRLVPLIKGIHRTVPIDIVSGVSGGAMLGAYYCLLGPAGLDRCVRLGEQIGAQKLTEAFFDGSMFKTLVDGDVGAVNVNATNIRLAALTTALLENDPPQSHVVVSGSIGDAVQVSGAAPVLFAPVVKDTKKHKKLHFSDGAMSAFVPARILRDCGADFVLAFNCLSGPERRNPFDGVRILETLATLPIAERLVDLWIAGSYLAQRIGRETDEDAHVYFEPDEEAMPLVESFNFADGLGITKRAMGPKMRQCIKDCKQAWIEFRTYE